MSKNSGRLREGEQSEGWFERIFKDNYAAMYRTAFTMLGDEEQSKDIVSDVFTRLWQGDINVRPETERAFLLICVKNSCRNLIARMGRERLRVGELCSGIEKLMYPMEQQDDAQDWDENDWDEVNEFMTHELTEQTCRVLKLCFLSGYSYKEAAEELHVSTSAINKHIVSGLHKLRERFQKNCRF